MTKEEQDKEEPIKEINIIAYQQSHKDATAPTQGVMITLHKLRLYLFYSH
jgi:hypothetical protein